MKRDEALDILKDVLAYLDQGKMPIGFKDSAPAALAALSSCACGGREPIARGWLMPLELEEWQQGIRYSLSVHKDHEPDDYRIFIVLPEPQGE